MKSSLVQIHSNEYSVIIPHVNIVPLVNPYKSANTFYSQPILIMDADTMVFDDNGKLKGINDTKIIATLRYLIVQIIV